MTLTRKSNVCWYDFGYGKVMMTLVLWQTKHNQNGCTLLDRVAVGQQRAFNFHQRSSLKKQEWNLSDKNLALYSLCSNNSNGPYINLIRKCGGGGGGAKDETMCDWQNFISTKILYTPNNNNLYLQGIA
jgi:hypothetical protein